MGEGDGQGRTRPGGRRALQQFLLAAKTAGVDLEDEQALGTFIKGWNARSELDLADLEVPQAIEPDEILQLKITLKGISKPASGAASRSAPTPPSRRSTRSSRRRSAGPTRTCTASSTMGQQIGVPDPEWDDDCADETETTLDEVLLGPKDRVRYTYDFGDNWEHDIVLEKVMSRTPAMDDQRFSPAKAPARPEDCGGPWATPN